jgi:mannose-6-phosphate isomerase-like protein (cupin superfamily)
MQMNKINLDAIGAELKRPFETMLIGEFGTMQMMLYLCEGAMQPHRHLDHEEIFMVHEGIITLETERGEVNLHAEEVVRMPRGVGHTSMSVLPSLVLLWRPHPNALRTNGHNRLVGLKEKGGLPKVRVRDIMTRVLSAHEPRKVIGFHGYEMALTWCVGMGPWQSVHEAAGEPIWALRGSCVIDMEEGAIPMQQADLIVAPPGTRYRLSAPTEGAQVLRIIPARV